MNTQEALQTAQTLVASYSERFETPEDGRLDAYLRDPECLADVVRVLVDAGGWHLSAITGLDVPQSDTSEGEIEVLYHFCHRAAILTLRIRVPYGLPEAPSICGVIPSATLYERELIEMFGVILTGTPSRARLLLPDDWPDWVYPMRKSFKGLE